MTPITSIDSKRRKGKKTPMPIPFQSILFKHRAAIIKMKKSGKSVPEILAELAKPPYNITTSRQNLYRFYKRYCKDEVEGVTEEPTAPVDRAKSEEMARILVERVTPYLLKIASQVYSENQATTLKKKE